MLTCAAICPPAPLLVPELTGSEPVGEEVRRACETALAAITATKPDLIVVLGVAESTSGLRARGVSSLGRVSRGMRPDASAMPLSVSIGVELLDRVGWEGPVLTAGIAHGAESSTSSQLADVIDGRAGRVALVAMADGSARATAQGPGYLHPGADVFDERLLDAVQRLDQPSLLAVPMSDAADQMSWGWPPLRVLAYAARGQGLATVLYSGAPFGVFYVVAEWRMEDSSSVMP